MLLHDDDDVSDKNLIFSITSVKYPLSSIFCINRCEQRATVRSEQKYINVSLEKKKKETLHQASLKSGNESMTAASISPPELLIIYHQ